MQRILIGLLMATALAACDRAPAPPQQTTTTTSPGDNQDFITRQVTAAMDKARTELANSNISVDDTLNIGGRKRVHDSATTGLPKAEISPKGDLLIDGTAVPVSDSQRQALLAYRGQILAIADAGMKIGAKGASVAGKAVTGMASAIFGGEQARKQYESAIEAQAKHMEAEAIQLCKLMPGLLASQQATAAAVPAFKPYARMTQADVDDCGKQQDAAQDDAGTTGAAAHDPAAAAAAATH